jgi:hypothetical protein
LPEHLDRTWPLCAKDDEEVMRSWLRLRTCCGIANRDVKRHVYRQYLESRANDGQMIKGLTAASGDKALNLLLRE